MMKHYAVWLNDEPFVVVADDEVRAEELAYRKWMVKYGPKKQKTERLITPCQWSKDCLMGIKFITCGECRRHFLGLG